MDIVIDYASAEPIYRQLYEQIRAQIMNGSLNANDSLPPIRSIAVELGISVITVKKAWEELEHDGLIVTVAGKGCFVAKLHESELSYKKIDMLTQRIKSDIAYYRSFGIADDDLLDIIKKNIE